VLLADFLLQTRGAVSETFFNGKFNRDRPQVRLAIGVADRLKTSTAHLSGGKRLAPMKRENINWVRL